MSQCLESVLNQDYKNLEVILWDNCSDDNSKKIVTRYKDNRIIYFFSKKKLCIKIEIKQYQKLAEI